MPDNSGVKTYGGAGAGRSRGAYQDRDKPAQIRFSNIAAGKGAARPGRGRDGPPRPASLVGAAPFPHRLQALPPPGGLGAAGAVLVPTSIHCI